MLQAVILKTRHLKLAGVPVAFVFLLLAAVGVTEAQSGRRPPKRGGEVQTLPIPEPTVEPKIQPKTDLPETFLSVMSDIPQTLYMKFNFPEKMQAWVVDRLRKSSALEVGTDAAATRSEAINRAKKATETFTIFLQLEEDAFSSSSGTAGNRSNVRNLWINYYIYFPKTGKARQNGRVPLDSGQSISTIGKTRTGISCYPGVYGDDLLLLQASLEVADRIMSNFNVLIPPLCSNRL